MTKKIRHFLSKIIFAIVFVYISFVGLFNVTIALNKTKLERFLARKLNAQSVEFNNISNLPLVFISASHIVVKVNDEMSLSIEGVYFYYRIWKVFSKQYEQILGDLRIETIKISAHTAVIGEYITSLKELYSPKQAASKLFDAPFPNKIAFEVEDMDMRVEVKQVEISLRSMQEFHHNLVLNSAKVSLNNNNMNFGGKINLHSVWSNCVFLASSSIETKGSISNLQSLTGNVFINIQNANLAGLPIIDKTVTIHLSLSNNKVSANFINKTKQNISVDTQPNNFEFSIDKSFAIQYNEFEEYNLLDYVFDQGNWNFKLNMKQTDQLFVESSFKSKQYPDYGMSLSYQHFHDNLYQLKLNLNTHYFGAINANLLIDFQEGFYPLPSGTATLKNVRFILPGLVFSGDAVVERIPNKNAMNVTAFNVEMNEGYIGHTATRFEFPPDGRFLIKPLNIPNMAVKVTADIGKTVYVRIDALDVDGDFVYKNIKLPFFGIATSRYHGLITIEKKGRTEDVLVFADVVGVLDGEDQILAQLYVKNTLLQVPKFYFINQDLLLKGDIDIIGKRTNTKISIDAIGMLGQRPSIPINVDVVIQKKNAQVTGTIDDQVTLFTDSDSINTSFGINFTNYSLSKIGVPGNLDGILGIDFDLEGWTRFFVYDAFWHINQSVFRLSFDSERDSNSTNGINILNTSNLQIGLGTEVLNGKGYFSISKEGNIGGAFNFDQGGSLSFLTAAYTWQLKTDINQFLIQDITKLPIIDQYKFLNNDSINAAFMTLSLDLKGLWANPDINARLALHSTGASSYFNLVVPEIKKQKELWTLTNVRLRSDLINLDTDMTVGQNGTNIFYADLSGSVAVLNAIKSKYSLQLFNSNNFRVLNYCLPNLYLLSKKSMDISGTIFNKDDAFTLLSDDPKDGLVGTFSSLNNSWELAFQSDSVQFTVDGKIVDDQIASVIHSKFLLDKMSFVGDVRKINGSLELTSQITGTLENPVVNGSILLNDLVMKFQSLKNTIAIPEIVQIPISNNTISFNNITVKAGRDNLFGLDGSLEFRDRAISGANLNFYSKNTIAQNISSLNWNMRIPFLSLKGKTLIKKISLTHNPNNLLLSADITTENMNIGLELSDSFSTFGKSSIEDQSPNPVAMLMSLLDLDIKLDVNEGFRFFNQLFDLSFEKNAGIIAIQGNIADNTVLVSGSMDIAKGNVNYLNTKLKVESGSLIFSQEYGDPYPVLNLDTVTTKYTGQNEQVEIYVNFQGKVPNIKLANISSNPPLNTIDLLNILSGGRVEQNVGNRDFANNSSEEFLASGVDAAENLLFTAPLSQRLQRLLPFIDLIEIKTGFLGNITRVLSDGGTVSGLSILHGSELSIGQFIPNLPNVQIRYDLRLESPYNTSINTDTGLTQIHKAGLEWSYPVQKWRLGLRPSFLAKTGANAQQEVPEFLFETSAKLRW